MPSSRSLFLLRVPVLILICFAAVSIAHAQGAKQTVPQSPIADVDADHIKERSEWFFRGRLVRGKPSAELRRRAYQAKLKMRAQHAAVLATAQASDPAALSTGSWIPLGPVPLASDATGNGTQDYHQVSGRATAVAIDPADPSGNTVYIGGAQSGVWKSINAANPTANSVAWTPMTDNQATLSIGAIAIQPGNSDPANSVILAATGEADNSSDSYFGLGILRSTDAGSSWTLIPTANNGALSFAGLGGTRTAFSTASGQTNTVVSAMATTSEGMVDGAVTAGTTRGLYTSLDAGQTWTYDALVDPGGATDATSATSVVYNASAGQFFAAIRYHGFYSSPDGVNWTRLAVQPGGAALSTTACPPQSTTNNYACPIYRGEITVVPGRNEMYAWYISLAANGSPVDGGIWQSLNGGASWISIPDASITNCGDIDGCGVQQGSYNLELLAVPSGSATDFYAGAINLYKCSITASNPTCALSPFMNLTHVFGCDPIAAPSHVHPDQHALAYAIPTSGSDSANALLYFANDGGIYRALNGFQGLSTGSCSGTNQFDDLNQNLGSMTQFVSFSQHPTDANTLLGGTQDNGSPATNQATTNPSWGNVLGGDGGYNAIDPGATSNWYASNPDVPPGGLGVQLCSSGVNCDDSGFSFVATSSTVGGDDGAFYFPFILDPQSSTAMLVGTCRVWRGPRDGGAFTVLSPNFDTLSSAICSGSEVNQVRALAAGGPTDANGSSVIYATTSALGPLDGPLSSPAGGHVWVTMEASVGIPAFADVTDNGPQGNINPSQFPLTSVAVDSSDPTGNTAYVTVMGFTGGAGHIWQTTNAGATWTDFTGNLPDSPVNAVVVYPAMSQIYVATDVGVFGSSTSAPSWTELGPASSTDQPGFLPNVAVTALGVFNSGGQQLLRASTYGRGIWQFNLVVTPDFEISVANSPQTVFLGQTAVFNGAASALSGYASSVTLSCTAGTTAPPSTCSPAPLTLTPVTNTPFTVTAGGAGGAAGDYSFNVQAAGSDANQITHQVPVALHVVSFGLTTPSPASVTVPRGTTSSPVSFQATAAGAFDQTVAVSCTSGIANATCTLTPSSTVSPTASAPVNMTASVSVPAGTAVGSYPVTLRATTAGTSATQMASFTLNVTTNPDFILSEPTPFPEVNAGSTGTTGPISIASQDGFSGTVTLSCPNTYGAGSCSISPSTVSSFPATATLTINGTSFAAGAYALVITGTSGSITNTDSVSFNVGDYSISGTQALSLTPGAQGKLNLQLVSLNLYSGNINATCDASALSGTMCVLSPANPIAVGSGGTASLTATINVPNNAVPGNYNINITTHDTTGAPSHAVTVVLTVEQDFLLTSSTPSQTVTAGQTSGAYQLTIQPIGSSFTGAVTLSCTTGLPAQAQCMFNPSTPLTPGNSAVDAVMSISTVAASNSHRNAMQHAMLAAAGFLLPGIVMACAIGRKSRRPRAMRAVPTAMLLLLVISTLSCAGASNGGGGGGGKCSSVPGVPTGLTAAWSNTGTTLTWTPSSVGSGCSVISYSVFENGTLIATIQAATYGVAPLPPGSYTFTVAATDSYGTSAQSAQVGIYTITITGTSPGTPPDAGQGRQVILVVN
ncbi:MAG TPA: hypothetical protein VKF84_11495 [Candidatus Sulfotelmatobacter sp.]|nr:hypothetical protein [Candidatus Sulfotelmatobacter sp.]